MVKDAALIGAAQRVEHYEIAAYGTVREFTRQLGHDDIARSLDITLQEEGDTDKELSRIARGTYFETGINYERSDVRRHAFGGDVIDLKR